VNFKSTAVSDFHRVLFYNKINAPEEARKTDKQMHFKHQYGPWKLVRIGAIGDNNVAGSGFDKPEHDGKVGIAGDFLVQKRQCAVCNFVRLHRQEVY